MANEDIREKLKTTNVRQWQLADYLHISEFNFCRKLRKELPQEEKDKIFNAIEELKGGNKKYE